MLVVLRVDWKDALMVEMRVALMVEMMAGS
jgi:hypothetical protein